MSEKFDNIVIGTGMSGLVCAGYLAKAGKKTLLLERNANIGGRTVSIKMNGYNICMHLPTLIFAENNGVGYGWANVAKDFGIDIRANLSLPARFYLKGNPQSFDMLNCYSTEGIVAWMIDYLEFARPDLVFEDLGKVLMPLVDEIMKKPFKEMCEEWDEISVKDWVEARSKNPSVKWLFNSLLAASLAFGDEFTWTDGSASKGFILLRAFLGGHGAMVVVHPDVQDGMVKPIVDAITTKYGCVIRTNSPVSEVLIENGKAVGVAIKRDGQSDEIIHADKVVVATEWKDYKNMFKTMPASLEETLRIPSTRTKFGMMVLTGLNDSVTLPGNIIFYMNPENGGKILGGCAQNVEQPWNVPEGKQLFWTYVKTTRTEFNTIGLEGITKRHNELLEEIFPGYNNAIEFQIPKGGIGPYSYEYTSAPKIRQKSPDVEGLYFTGEATYPIYGVFSDGCASAGISTAKNILELETLVGI